MRDPAIRVMMMPRDTNAFGTIFGGVLLSYIDQAGALEARRYTDHKVVTVAMKEVVFHEPVQVGDMVSFYTHTQRIGRTSVTVDVEVEATRRGALGNPSVRVTQAQVTYVAVDGAGCPVPLRQRSQSEGGPVNP